MKGKTKIIHSKPISAMPHKPFRVCAYVRVSTEHNAQLQSLANQTDYYNNKFLDHPHCIFVGVFSDSGISGAKEDRPGFQAMLAAARAGDIDLIYTKSVSRFARNALMLLEVVRELKAIGVGIVFQEENLNTLSSEGELMLTVLAGIAEEERKSTRSNVQLANRNRYLQGVVAVDSDRLLGYEKNESGKLTILSNEADIVRHIYRLYLSGINASQIAQFLNEGHVKSYKGRPWKSSRVLSILSNEKYAGNCLLQKSYVDEEGKQVRNRGQRDRYYVEDAHPPIVSQEDWEEVQLLRKKRARKAYPYTSLLRCAYCGSTMIRVAHCKRWVSWICVRYLRKGKDTCIGSRIPEWLLAELTKENPIKEPMVVMEVQNETEGKKPRKKDYRLIPFAESPYEKG